MNSNDIYWDVPNDNQPLRSAPPVGGGSMVGFGAAAANSHLDSEYASRFRKDLLPTLDSTEPNEGRHFLSEQYNIYDDRLSSGQPKLLPGSFLGQVTRNPVTGLGQEQAAPPKPSGGVPNSPYLNCNNFGFNDNFGQSFESVPLFANVFQNNLQGARQETKSNVFNCEFCDFTNDFNEPKGHWGTPSSQELAAPLRNMVRRMICESAGVMDFVYDDLMERISRVHNQEAEKEIFCELAEDFALSDGCEQMAFNLFADSRPRMRYTRTFGVNGNDDINNIYLKNYGMESICSFVNQQNGG